jgi:hypothetical protein
MLLLSSILPFLTLARHVSAVPIDSFAESLTLHPLPDGKLSVLFEFTTHFTGSSKAGERLSAYDASALHTLKSSNFASFLDTACPASPPGAQ